MNQTSKLSLAVLPEGEFSTTQYRDFILAMAGDTTGSNMALIDASVGSLQETLTALEAVLATI